MARRAICALSAGILLTLVAPANAPAFQIIGQIGPSDSCSQDQAYTQRDLVAGPSYSPTVDSVIISYRTYAPQFSDHNIQLLVLRPDADYGEPLYHMTPVREDALRNFPVPNQVATVTGLARIPIAASERLGFYMPPAGGGCAFETGNGGDALGFSQPDGDPPLGATAVFSGGSFGARLNLEAIIEPDCDHDGFGDESQDPDPPAPLACAIDAISPETDIIEHPRGRSFRRRARFEFISSEAGSSFACSFDGEEFAPCTSPLIEKVSRGKHSFEVRASDGTGNIDPTPASDKWKVKKKK